jgi:hypothetical protein
MSRPMMRVSHSEPDPMTPSKRERESRRSVAELKAARERQQQIEQAQAASVAAALKTPSRPVLQVDGKHGPGEGVSTSQRQASSASGVRGGGLVPTSPPASVPSRPALTIPPGARVMRVVEPGGVVLDARGAAILERLVADAQSRAETEE